MSRRTPAPTGGRSGLALLGTIGGYVAVSFLVGLGAGLLLDHIFRTGPLFLIAGSVLGFIGSFYFIYRTATGDIGE